jgi:hypothetical protein
LAHFLFGENSMQKKENTNLRENVEKIAEKVREQIMDDYILAKANMWIAEKALLKSLSEEQIPLYEEFYNRRSYFYEVAGEIFQKKF